MIACGLALELDAITGKLASASRVTAAPAAFTALYLNDFSSGTPGESIAGWNTKTVYADDQPGGVGQSMKVVLAAATPPTCGGEHGFGGRINLPVDIPKGKTIWYSQKRYHSSDYAWGYCFQSSDSVEAAGCSKSADGTTWLKDLVLGPSIGTARIYASPQVGRRNLAQLPGIRVVSEASQVPDDNVLVSMPLDEWFSYQLMVKVGDDGTGIMRVYINSTLVCEYIGANISADSGNVIRNFGIGDYWNGIPYTTGAANQNHFWVKDIIIATDVEGYGAPTGVDEFDNAYIDPTTTVAELS